MPVTQHEIFLIDTGERYRCRSDQTVLAGMETLVAPLFSLIMIPVSLMTQASCPSKHHVNDEVPDDAEVLAGVC